MSSCTDLPTLMKSYQHAESQVEVLDRCIMELKQRQRQAEEMGHQPEFNYLQFKLHVMEEVKKLYQEYRDSQWVKLQQESSSILRDILQSDPEVNEDQTIDPIFSPVYPSSALLSPPLTPVRDGYQPMSQQTAENVHYSSIRDLSDMFLELDRNL